MYEPQCNFVLHFWLFGGGGGWVPLQLTEWAQVASQLSTHLYQSTYKKYMEAIR